MIIKALHKFILDGHLYRPKYKMPDWRHGESIGEDVFFDIIRWQNGISIHICIFGDGPYTVPPNEIGGVISNLIDIVFPSKAGKGDDVFALLDMKHLFEVANKKEFKSLNFRCMKNPKGFIVQVIVNNFVHNCLGGDLDIFLINIIPLAFPGAKIRVSSLDDNFEYHDSSYSGCGDIYPWMQNAGDS